MRWPFVISSRVPDELAGVTSIHRDAEVQPREVGVTPPAVARVWRAVERVYQTGLHPAIQLCVRRHGQVLIDRAIGYASGNGPDDPPDAKKIQVTVDTPFTIYSASKAVTAMLVHLLDQRHQLHIEDPVCEYIPEFGVHKKQWITIRHILSHRAGIPNLPPELMDLDNLADPKRILRIMCDAAPTSRPGRQLAYHAVSGGFILGEVVRRVTGKDIRTVLDEEICRPLGFRWMNYGVARREVKLVARNYFTGPPPMPPLSTLLDRGIGTPFRNVVTLSNDPRFFAHPIPSGNIVATANELSSFYQLLLNGGELDGVRIFDRRTIRRATAEQSYLEIDFTLGLPFRYSMGFMLGGSWFSVYGPDTQYAFGHVGFTNIVSWADPERQVAATLMTSGKPLLYPQIVYVFDIMRQIASACPKERSRLRPVDTPQRRARKRKVMVPRQDARTTGVVTRMTNQGKGNDS